MNKNQLFNLLTQLDDRYYEEALGGDPAKPLRIDVSRKPVKWYRIAAPIAACLIIGAGIIAAPRVIDRIRTTTSDPDPNVSIPAISDPDAVVSDPNVSSDSTGADFPPELSDYYEHYPVIDLSELTGNEPTDETGADLTLSVTKYKDCDICLTGNGVYRISDSDILHAENYSISLIKDGERYSHIDIGNDFSLYAGYIPQPDIFDLSGHTVGACIKLFSIKDYKLSLLKGTIERKVVSDELEQQDDALIDRQNGYKYVFNFESFDDPEWKNMNFITYYPKIEDDPTINLTHYYPYLNEDKLPYFKLDPTEEDKKLMVKRAILEEFTLDTNGSSDNYRHTKVALVAEDLYRYYGDEASYIARGKNLAIIMYRDNKLLKKIDLAPDYERTTVNTINTAFPWQYRIGGYTIALFNRSCFVAITEDGEMTLLKGLMPDGTMNTEVRYKHISEHLAQDGDSLVDIEGGFEYRFHPENFKYTNPSAAQAHFTVIDDLSEFDSKPTDGHIYNIGEKNIPMPDISGYNAVLGTQADLDRWNSFISSMERPLITCISVGKSKQMDLNKEMYITFRIIQDAKLGLLDELPDPSLYQNPIVYDPEMQSDRTGRRAPEFFGYDSSGNLLFSLYFYNEEFVQVTFDGSKDSYIFDARGSGISEADNYMDDYM